MIAAARRGCLPALLGVVALAVGAWLLAAGGPRLRPLQTSCAAWLVERPEARQVALTGCVLDLGGAVVDDAGGGRVLVPVLPDAALGGEVPEAVVLLAVTRDRSLADRVRALGADAGVTERYLRKPALVGQVASLAAGSAERSRRLHRLVPTLSMDAALLDLDARGHPVAGWAAALLGLALLATAVVGALRAEGDGEGPRPAAAEGEVRAPDGEDGIVVQGLVRTFRKGSEELRVLRGIDLVLRRGERVAIQGESGSGKSTFLHVLGTLDRPTAGRIWMGGVDVFARPPAELDALRNRFIGFVFQFHHLLPDQDALHNVMIPALIAGQPGPEAARRARALLERVGLGGRLHHRPGELSGGEQQRVAIARALVREPALILADEPTGNLDPSLAADVLDLLIELNEETGSTLVVVTHSAELARRFPRRLLLRDGRFVEVGEERGEA